MTQKYKVPSKHIHPHFTGNDKGLYATMRGGRIDISQNIRQHFRPYATMIGGRIDPSSCLDTCWVDKNQKNHRDMHLHLFGHPLAFFGKQFLDFLPVSIIDIYRPL